MRTLFVISHPPLPLNVGGNLRPYHLLRAIAGVSDVTLFCAATPNRDPDAIDDLRGLCTDVVVFPGASFRWRQRLHEPRPRLRALLDAANPFELGLVDAYRSADAVAALRRLNDRHFDLVWVERLHLLRSLPDFKSRVILDLNDIEHRKLARKLRRVRIRRGSVLDLAEFLKSRALERRLYPRFPEVVVCSEADRAALGAHPCAWVVPNGIDLPRGQDRHVTPPPAPTFAFVGAMFYEPNIDAVHFFARRIFPLILQRLPNARFVIIGRDPTADVRALHDGSRITVTGTVPATTPYLRATTVAVVPLRYGSGTRIKILEAFAHRVAVVSSTLGAEGLDVDNGRHILLADDPRAFAAACIRLATNKPARSVLIDQAHDLVVHRYQWQQIERLVQQIVARSPATNNSAADPGRLLRAQ